MQFVWKTCLIVVTRIDRHAADPNPRIVHREVSNRNTKEEERTDVKTYTCL